MLRVWRASGQELAALPAGELSDVRSLKQHLHDLCGVPRFRQRLLFEGRALEEDCRQLKAGDLQLVLLPFCEDSEDLAYEFYSALRYRRVAKVEDMLRRPVHPDLTCTECWGTPIYFTAHRGDEDLVRLLLEARAKTDDRHRQGFTALGIACAVGRANIASALLEAGVDLNEACTAEGATPLGAAADRGREAVVQMLLEARADMEKSWGKEAMTPLALAALKGRVEVVSQLLEAGADKERCCHDGSTALHLASREGHTEVVQMLLDAGASADASRHDGATALGLAARRGGSWSGPFLAIARLLLEASADKDKAGRGDGAPPLGIATSRGHIDMVRLLLEVRADANKGWVDGASSTSLGVACRYGRVTIVSLLLEAGADLDKPCRRDGGTALRVAFRLGTTTILKLLLDARADQEKAWGPPGKTLLHEASWRGRGELVRLLRAGV